MFGIRLGITSLAALPELDGDLTDVEVNEVLGLVGDKGAE